MNEYRELSKTEFSLQLNYQEKWAVYECHASKNDMFIREERQTDIIAEIKLCYEQD